MRVAAWAKFQPRPQSDWSFIHFGSKKRGCIFDFVVSPPGSVGYGRLRPLVFQAMSDYCEDAVAMVQSHIDRFDSIDDAMSAGAVSVNEDIIQILVSPGRICKVTPCRWPYTTQIEAVSLATAVTSV